MAHVVDYDEFEALRQEVRAEREENQFYRELFGQVVQLTRRQACAVLQISDTTMHRLIWANKIAYTSEGNRQKFSVKDLVEYLKKQKIASSTTQKRILSSTKDKK